MTLDEVKQLLISNGFSIQQEMRLTNDTGTQLRLQSGQIVNVFDKGTYNIQGKNPGPIKDLLQRANGRSSPNGGAVSRKVFVVYGHDVRTRNELEAMLRRWNIEPLILDQLPSSGMTIIEKLEQCQGDVVFGVVLATPDDEGYRAGRPDEKAYRVRQNVVLELVPFQFNEFYFAGFVCCGT
jgi:predicted nucleotide-binding protein